MSKELWEEFIVDTIGLNKIWVCGICGNKGWFRSANSAPNGMLLDREVFYCICPNGRSMKGKKQQEDSKIKLTDLEKHDYFFGSKKYM